jgi:hypothetical protein
MLWNGNECGKTKVKRNLMQPFAVYHTKLETVAHFSHLVSLITKDARFFTWNLTQDCHEKGTFNNKKTLFTRKLDLI